MFEFISESWILLLICLVCFFPIFFATVVNKSNAHHFLSNYNALSPEEKQNFDMDGFVFFFRKVYGLLGVVMFVGSVLLYLKFGYKFSFLWLAISIIFGHTILVSGSQKYSHSVNEYTSSGLIFESRLSMLVLIISALLIVFGIIFLYFMGYLKF